MKSGNSLTVIQLNDRMTAHWEFAYGPEAFKLRAAELIYPMLAINVFYQATQERLFPPYRVKAVGGLRIGLVGKYGRNRQHHTERSIEALKTYLDRQHRPLRAELRGTFVAV